MHFCSDAAKDKGKNGKPARVGLGWVVNCGEVSYSFGKLIDYSEDLPAAEKFLFKLSIYELELLSVDMGIQMLVASERLGEHARPNSLGGKNCIIHCDNNAACFALQKGAGATAAGSVAAAQATATLARYANEYKYRYINTTRNPADALSRIGELDDCKAAKNYCITDFLPDNYYEAYVAQFAATTIDISCALKNDPFYQRAKFPS